MDTPIFVAEFTTNHMGNLNLALRMAERVAAAGCDLIKMQKKDVESFYTEEKLNRPYNSPFGQTYREYRTMFEFSSDDFRRFDAKCRELGVHWFATVQDSPSLGFMVEFDLPLYKIASSNARDYDFLREVHEVVPPEKPMVLSVGGSTIDEIEEALDVFGGREVFLLHCVASYPCPPENLRLGNIGVLREKFASDKVHIGYSGHEKDIAGSVAAAELGAEMIERHFCVSRYSFVHHIECSLEPDEFAKLVSTVKTGRGMQEAIASLPEKAFESDFGMSEVEALFLVEQRYGQDYLGDESKFDG